MLLQIIMFPEDLYENLKKQFVLSFHSVKHRIKPFHQLHYLPISD